MATRAPNPVTKPETGGYYESQIILWEGITQNDDASAYGGPDLADRSVQLVGDFDGATITIQGSLDGTTFATLKDLDGNDLSFTAAGLKGVRELVAYIKPVRANGGGSTDIDVYLIARKP